MNAPDKLPASPEPHVMSTYGRLPMALAYGRGCWLWDTEGRKYLDGLAGIAVNTLGHAHPKLVPALRDQIGKLIHSSNYYLVPLQEQLAARLCELSGLTNVFFCNSGLEANEAALKIARKYGHDRGVAEPAIIVMEKAFHGRSLATLSATGSRKVQAGFEPLVSGFVRVPLNDLEAVRQVAEHNKNVVAVLIEPIQGEGGINVSRLEYLRGLKEICERKEWLFISDEVQCGVGRTGKWFVYQHAGFLPDVVPIAKGLAGGVPVGACVIGGRAKGVFKPGNHGSTFGGNPLACAAALATLDIIEEERLMDNAVRTGDYIRTELTRQIGGLKGVRQIRGQGLMIGIELDYPCGELVQQALDRGMLINVTVDNVIRLLPPLVFRIEEAGLLLATLVPLVRQFLDRQGAPQAAAQSA